MWDSIHPDVGDASKDIAEAGKYDDAIFAAFRLVEGTIQERLDSRSIGTALLSEAFDSVPPKLLISMDARDQEGVKQLFTGALSNIRNDRGHKKVPLLPCTTLDTCVLYLSFASLLLYLLRKDRALFPVIQSIRMLGTQDQPRVELRGRNFTDESQVFIGPDEARVLSHTREQLEVLLPRKYSGSIRVVDADRESAELLCDTHYLEERLTSCSELERVEIPLYEDATCTTIRSNVVGIIVKDYRFDRIQFHIKPTRPGKYQSGTYVTIDVYETEQVGESWYRDPQTGEVLYAWTSSLIVTPTVIGKVEAWKPTGLMLSPREIKTELGNRRTLRAVAFFNDGPARKQADVTNDVKWYVHDTNVAFVERSGVVIPKTLGNTTVDATFESYVSTSEIIVANYHKGDRCIFFQGLRRLQQIRFDSDDNLFVCNQSPNVFQIAKDGGLQTVLQVTLSSFVAPGIDCIAVDSANNLYVSNLDQRVCHRFSWNGAGYEMPITFATSLPGTPKKSIALGASGEIFVGVMNKDAGAIIRVDPDGRESVFFTQNAVTNLALGPDGHLYSTSMHRGSVVIFDRVGNLIEEIPHGIRDTASDILVDHDGSIFLPFFRSGTLVKLTRSPSGWTGTVVADGLGIPGGIAMDSRRRIYVSNFEGDTITLLY